MKSPSIQELQHMMNTFQFGIYLIVFDGVITFHNTNLSFQQECKLRLCNHIYLTWSIGIPDLYPFLRQFIPIRTPFYKPQELLGYSPPEDPLRCEQWKIVICKAI